MAIEDKLLNAERISPEPEKKTLQIKSTSSRRSIQTAGRKRGRKSKKELKTEAITILASRVRNGDDNAKKLLEQYHYVLSVKKVAEEQIVEYILKDKGR